MSGSTIRTVKQRQGGWRYAAWVVAMSGLVTTGAALAEDDAAQVSWKGAPEFRSADGDWGFKVRGRVMLDMWTTTDSNVNDNNITGTETRASRIGVDGWMWEDFLYRYEVDFSGNGVNTLDAWIQYRGFEPWQLSVGHKYLDMSLDGKTSLLNGNFMERSIILNAVRPGAGTRGLGLEADTGGSNWHWNGSIRGDGTDNSGTADDTLSFTTRATYAPVNDKGRAVHLGGWAYAEDYPDDPTIRLRPRIGNHFNDLVRASTGSLPNADSAVAYGLELGGVWRSFDVAAEYMVKSFEDEAGLDPKYSGYYLAAGWFITGESRPYSGRRGTFGRPKPTKSVAQGGPGAVQLVARYDSADFDDAVPGDQVDAYTLGVNWYLVPNVRIQFNYVYYDLETPTGDDSGNHFGARFQLHW